MEKTKIPLYVHEILENTFKPQLEKYDCWYKYEAEKDGLKPILSFEIRAMKPNEDFFFSAMERYPNGFSIASSPFSEMAMTGTYQSAIGGADIGRLISSWEKLVERYATLQSSFFEDPIIQDYEDEFYSQWRLMEEDADTKPFDLPRQLMIDKYLEGAIKTLDTHKTKENEKEIDAVKTQAAEIRQTLTRKTKNQVVRGLAKFWAMAQKMGLDVLKDVLLNIAADIVKKRLLPGL